MIGLRASLAALLSVAPAGCRSDPTATPDAVGKSRPTAANQPTPTGPRVFGERRGCAGRCEGWTQLLFDWHEAAVIDISAAGTGAVSIAHDGTLRGWGEALGPRFVRVLDVDPEARVAGRADSDIVAVATSGKLWWFSTRDGAAARTPVALGAVVRGLELRPDGTTLVADAKGVVSLFGDGAPVRVDLEQPISAAASDGGASLAVAVLREEFGALLLVDLTSRGVVGEFDTGVSIAPPVFDLAFDAAGHRIVAAGYDLSLWDLASRTRIAATRVGTVPTERAARSPGFSADGKSIDFVAIGGQLARWTPEAQSIERLPVETAAISAGGMTLTDAWVGTSQGHVERIARGDSTRRVGPSVGAGATALAFTPDDAMLIAGLTDGSLVAWDLRSRAEVTRGVVHEGEVNAIAFVDPRTFVSAGGDGARLVSVDGLRPAATLGAAMPALSVKTCAGPTIVVGWADGFIGWFTPTEPERPRFTVDAHDAAVLGLDVLADCSLVVSCAEDGRIRVWAEGEPAPTSAFDIEPPRPLQAVAWIGPTALVSAEAFMGNDVIRRWSLLDGGEGPPLATTRYGAAAIAVRGPEILVADLAEGAVLWSTPEPAPQARFPHFDGTAMAVAWSPTGQFVALGTTGNEATVRVWTRDGG